MFLNNLSSYHRFFLSCSVFNPFQDFKYMVISLQLFKKGLANGLFRVIQG